MNIFILWHKYFRWSTYCKDVIDGMTVSFKLRSRRLFREQQTLKNNYIILLEIWFIQHFSAVSFNLNHHSSSHEGKSSHQNLFTQKIVIGSVVSVAMIAAFTFLTVKRLRIRISRKGNSYKMWYTRQATNEENEYLIIYARELQQFERVVDALKRLLSCENCSKVRFISRV